MKVKSIKLSNYHLDTNSCGAAGYFPRDVGLELK